MKFVNRDKIKIKPLPGRALQLFTGQVDAASYSEGITKRFCPLFSGKRSHVSSQAC